MVSIRNPSVNPPYIYFIFTRETLQLRKTHRFLYLITSLRFGRTSRSLLVEESPPDSQTSKVDVLPDK
ncbi:hypothetical protein Bca4012_067399 [Brassica carinata]